jgi:hypothetical protein
MTAGGQFILNYKLTELTKIYKAPAAPRLTQLYLSMPLLACFKLVRQSL